MNYKVCHVSTVHSRYDIRIFLKQASSLAKESFISSVSLLVADNLPDEVKNNVNIKSIGLPSSRINRMLNLSRKMLQKAIQENADVYHIHDPEIYWFVIFLRRNGKKVILDLHEHLPSQVLSKSYLHPATRKGIYFLTKSYDSFILPKANAIVTATPFIKEINSRYNSNIVCISNFPMLDEFKHDTDWSLKERSVCYTGGLSVIRGVGYLIDSVLKSDSDWVLNLAGPISDSATEKKLKDALQKTDRIKYWGNVDRITLKTIFSTSKAGFVTFLPVPNHLNAVPNKLFEYMSSGLPIICSSFKFWKEIVDENEVGIAIDPENVDEIIRSVNIMLDNSHDASRWGQNGILAVQNKYNWEAESKKLFTLYKELK